MICKPKENIKEKSIIYEIYSEFINLELSFLKSLTRNYTRSKEPILVNKKLLIKLNLKIVILLILL